MTKLILPLMIVVMPLMGAKQKIKERKLSPEEKKIVGVYDRKKGVWPDGRSVSIYRTVYLSNGVREFYFQSQNTSSDCEWKLLGREVHYKNKYGNNMVERINSDKSVTVIGSLKDGKLRVYEPKSQQTSKKIDRELAPEEKKMVGIFIPEKYKGGLPPTGPISGIGVKEIHVYDFLENGLVIIYTNGHKHKLMKWKIVGKEVHVGEEHSQEFFKIESENVLSFNGQIIGHGPKKEGRIFFRTGRYIRKEMISK